MLFGVQWQVPRNRAVLKLLGAALFVLAGLLLGFGDRLALWIAVAAAAVLAISAVRDLVAPVRLAADEEGVTVVVGFAARRRLPWSKIEGVRLDARQRFGLTTELVEIDAGEEIHLFGERELGAPVREVVEALTELRPDAT